MKKLIIAVISLALFNTTYAYEKANLKVNIVGDSKKSYFLCINNIGCVNLNASKKKAFPLNPGEVNDIFMANIENGGGFYSQPLPDSCKVTLANDQTLTVSGKVTKVANKVLINNLQCSVG